MGGMSRAESIVQKINQVSPGFDIDPAQVTIIGPGGSGDPGGPGDVVTIQVDYTVDLVAPLIADLFPTSQHEFSINLLARNEPFPPSN